MVTTKGSSKRTLSLWALRRHLWEHRRENLFILAILAMGFLFYAVYSSWAGQMGMPEGVTMETLALPADMVLEVPQWTTGTGPPYNPAALLEQGHLHDQFRRDRLYQIMPRRLRPRFENPVTGLLAVASSLARTSGGTVEVWGVEQGWSSIEGAFPLASGRWPESISEVAVHASFLDKTGLEVGDKMTLLFPVSRAVTHWQTHPVIVGAYEGDYHVMPQAVIVGGETLRSSTGYKPNLYLVWAKDLPDIITYDRAGNVDLVYRQPQLADMVDGGLPPTRLPIVGVLPENSEYHPMARSALSSLPHATLIDDTPRSDGLPERGIVPLYRTMVLKLSPMASLIFISITIALTVVLAMVISDRQPMLGVFKILGVDGRQLRWLYFMQVLLLGLAASLLGLLLFHALKPTLDSHLGFDVSIARGALNMWGVALVFFGLWASHVAGVLFASGQIDSLLREGYELDWWSIIRI